MLQRSKIVSFFVVTILYFFCLCVCVLQKIERKIWCCVLLFCQLCTLFRKTIEDLYFGHYLQFIFCAKLNVVKFPWLEVKNDGRRWRLKGQFIFLLCEGFTVDFVRIKTESLGIFARTFKWMNAIIVHYGQIWYMILMNSKFLRKYLYIKAVLFILVWKLMFVIFLKDRKFQQIKENNFYSKNLL